jgi:predicted transcriptional regulator
MSAKITRSQIRPGPESNWPRYAKALDMNLEGRTYDEIAQEFGVTRQRAHQMIKKAKSQLAFRVFYTPRPIYVLLCFLLFGCAQPHRFDSLRQQQLQQQQDECLRRGGSPEQCRP